jgi:hypothetical protein
MADAKELTKLMEDTRDRVRELEKQVEYLTQEYEKQRLIINDMKVDVQMMQRARR